MSAYSTSSPSTVHTRRYLIRPPSTACTWWKRTSWLVVAEYSFTGTLTSPNETAPLHIARMGASMAGCSPCSPPLATFRRVPVGSTRSSGTACGCSPTSATDGSSCAPAAAATSPPTSRSSRASRRSRPTSCSTARSCCWSTACPASTRSPTACRPRTRRPARPVTYMAFDVLRLYGVPLLSRSFAERRATLERLDTAAVANLALSPIYTDGPALYAATAQRGMEGVIAKRRARRLPARAPAATTGSRPPTAPCRPAWSAAGGRRTWGRPG